MSKEKAYAYIRWSTKKQDGNDSKRRQLSLAQEYAEKKNLDLVVLIDEGVSAFHGGHFEQGKLGQFFEDVRSGVIEEGSTFIIERMDRLSREGLFKDRVKELLDEGLKIYISGTGRFLTKETWDISDEIISAIERDLAHKESEQKSDRLTEAWEDKRDEAAKGGRKLSKICPEWLEPVLLKDKDGNVVKDKNGNEIVIDFEKKDPKITNAIQLIFELKKNFGNSRIAKKLNERDDVKHPTGGNWRKSYVSKILKNDAVIGRYQPHEIYWEYSERLQKPVRKHRPKGDLITDYYEPVVDEDLFWEVQDIMEQRREKYGSQGGADKKHHNVFRHVIECGECGTPMHYIGRDHAWLHCDASRSNFTDDNGDIKCTASGIRYKEFEQKFFEEFEELDIKDILPNAEATADRVSELEQKIAANRQRIKELEGKEESLLEQMERPQSDKVRDKLNQRLEKIVDDIDDLEQQNKELDRQKKEAEKEAKLLRQAADHAQEYYDLMESAETEEQRIDYRIRLNKEIKNMVKKIQVWPLEELYQKEPVEVEPGIYKIYHSKYIDKIRIEFNNGESRILPMKRFGELAQ